MTGTDLSFGAGGEVRLRVYPTFRGNAGRGAARSGRARTRRDLKIADVSTYPVSSRLVKARWDVAANARAVTAVDTAAILEVWGAN